ncbi:MAG TPA: class I SAM-dependent methyltransferase [Thermoplasmata archaeon]|nr:class I SAM-dependent methyltransferase [Thermoplasmata archaeon]HEV2429079.1 class I SAM-dependent methyltransferase [Thermoplasmata archaeon]
MALGTDRPFLAALNLEEAVSEDPVRYRAWHLERIRRTARLVERWAPPSSGVLDVGASPLTVDFAEAIAGHPMTVLDPGPGWESELARHRIAFLRGSLSRIDLPSNAGPFGAVVVAEVFEHLVECPAHLVPRLIALLQPGGVLIVTTPNQARWLNRLRLLLGVNIQERPETLFHKQWMGFGHVREYTLGEFESEFRLPGLETLDIGGWSPHPMPKFDGLRRALDRWGPAGLDQVLFGVFRKG